MKNQMSEKRTIEGSSRTLLLFFLPILLSGRSGSGRMDAGHSVFVPIREAAGGAK